MEKKDYQKPTMLIIKLQHQAHLLSGSPKGPTGVEDYEEHSYEEIP